MGRTLLVALALFVLACDDKAGSDAPSVSARSTTSVSAATATATTTATVAASTPATASATTPAKCSLVGTWSGNYPPGPYPFSGKAIEVTFKQDGSGGTKSERAADEVAWTMEGDTLAWHGTKPSGGRYSCAKEQIGKYALAFAPDCGTVTTKIVSDPCAGRAGTMDKMTLKRK